MVAVWCVRGEYGRYVPAFLQGGYVAVGWEDLGDLSQVRTRDELGELYRGVYSTESNYVSGQQVGQLSRFLLEMSLGDVVLTPDGNTELVWQGELLGDPGYEYAPDAQDCPYPNRRRVRWSAEPLRRGALSVPLQNTLRSSLTVFRIIAADEILQAAGKPITASTARQALSVSARDVVLDQILKLDAKEFEFLVAHVLTALGFEGSEVTGKSGDGGVDAVGELNVSGLAKLKVYVQAKRYKRGATISAGTVRQLRQAIPTGGQGAFITTADFQPKAFDVALEQGFPRIGLVNGHQLVDLLVEHWSDIPKDFQAALGLEPGLVLRS